MPAVYTPPWAIALIWGGVIAAAVLMFFYVRRMERYWSKGIFPPNLKFTRENLMQAYISAAAMMLLKDRYQMTGKLAFINGYFHRQFPDCYQDFKKRYMETLQSPVSVKSLADWLNRYLEKESDRQQLVDFAIDLAWYDGDMNPEEDRIIRLLTAHLQLDVSAMEARVASHAQRNKSWSEEKETGVSDRKNECLHILGLADDSGEEEIKKAYRKLVLLYHPDKFMKDASEVQEKAMAKFREIQEAYDYLMTMA